MDDPELDPESRCSARPGASPCRIWSGRARCVASDGSAGLCGGEGWWGGGPGMLRASAGGSGVTFTKVGGAGRAGVPTTLGAGDAAAGAQGLDEWCSGAGEMAVGSGGAGRGDGGPSSTTPSCAMGGAAAWWEARGAHCGDPAPDRTNSAALEKCPQTPSVTPSFQSRRFTPPVNARGPVPARIPCAVCWGGGGLLPRGKGSVVLPQFPQAALAAHDCECQACSPGSARRKSTA